MKNYLSKALSKTAAVTICLLLIPLIVSQFTQEVVWTLSDYIIAGLLLFGTGSVWIVMTRKSGSRMYKAAVGLTLASSLFLIWINLAVGIIGSEDNIINLLYFLVVMLLIIGSLIARFQPSGMALTLFTTALAQAVTIPAVLLMGMQNTPRSSVIEIIMLNGLFITLFMVSGVLFWQDDKNRKSDH